MFVRKYEGEFSYEKTALSSIWQVEVNEFQYRGREIELKENEGKGPPILYKLRHFLTGKVMIQQQVK